MIAQCKRKSKHQNEIADKQSLKTNELSYAVYAATVGDEKSKHDWCVDSGATTHMCCDKNMFISLIERQEKIMLAADNYTFSQGIGTIKIKTRECEIELRDVLFVPSLKMNFYSVSKALQYKHTVTFKENVVKVKNSGGKTLLTATLQNNLFIFNAKVQKSDVHLNYMKWHNRYGHIHFESLKKIVDKYLDRGIDVKNIDTKTNCDTCNKAKISAVSFPRKNKIQSKQVLEIIHTDVCGPINVKSAGGARYFLTFVDDYSRMIFVYCIKEKSEVFEKFKLFKNMVACQTQKKIKILRSDNGTEFNNKLFNELLNDSGIKRQLTVPYTPQQNGVAERVNRTIVEMARSLLVHAGIEESLWGEAVHTAVYLRNRAPTKLLEDCTPYEMWYKRKPSVKHFRIFGSRAFALDKMHRGKFSAKGKEYVFVGYSEIAKAYRLYDRETRQVCVKRDVKFVEHELSSIIPENKNQNVNDDNDIPTIVMQIDRPNEEQVDEFESYTEDDSSQAESSEENSDVEHETQTAGSWSW